MTGHEKKKNFPITKSIMINESQNKNWNPKLIRNLLDSNNSDVKDLLQKLYDIMIIKMKPIVELTEEERNSIIKIKEVLNIDQKG